MPFTPVKVLLHPESKRDKGINGRKTFQKDQATFAMPFSVQCTREEAFHLTNLFLFSRCHVPPIA